MINRKVVFLLVIIITIIFVSCAHSLRRERLYNDNGWRIGPYEITLNPTFETDTLGEEDKAQIIGGIFQVLQIPNKLKDSDNTLPVVEIDSVGILLRNGLVKYVNLESIADTIATLRFQFDWEELEPLEDGSCVQYTLRLLDKASGKIIYHNKLEEDFGMRKWSQNYPHPFCPNSTIEFFMPNTGNYKVTIYDISGKIVAEFSGNAIGGENFEIEWKDGTNQEPGIYFYKIEAGDYSETRKLVLVK